MGTGHVALIGPIAKGPSKGAEFRVSYTPLEFMSNAIPVGRRVVGGQAVLALPGIPFARTNAPSQLPHALWGVGVTAGEARAETLDRLTGEVARLPERLFSAAPPTGNSVVTLGELDLVGWSVNASGRRAVRRQGHGLHGRLPRGLVGGVVQPPTVPENVLLFVGDLVRRRKMQVEVAAVLVLRGLVCALHVREVLWEVLLGGGGSSGVSGGGGGAEVHGAQILPAASGPVKGGDDIDLLPRSATPLARPAPQRVEAL